MPNILKKKKKANIKVKLDLDKYNWEAGEHITGKIIFNTDKELKISKVTLRLLCYEWIQITESYDVPQHKRTKVKTIFDSHPILIHNQKRREPVGETTYPFSIKLPDESPPTINAPNQAKISYQLKGDLNFPNFPNAMCVSEIIVHHPLSTDPPVAHTDKKSALFKGSIVLRAVPDKSCYVQDDDVELDLTIDNKTSKEIARIILSLERKMKYGPNKEQKSLKSIDITAPKLPIGPSSRYQEVINFQLPEKLVPTSKSNAIDIIYKLRIKNEFISGGEWSTYMPLVIGCPPLEPEEIDVSEVPVMHEGIKNVEDDDEPIVNPIVAEPEDDSKLNEPITVPLTQSQEAQNNSNNNNPQDYPEPPPGYQLFFTPDGQPVYICTQPQDGQQSPQTPPHNSNNNPQTQQQQPKPQPTGYGHPAALSQNYYVPSAYDNNTDDLNNNNFNNNNNQSFNG
eukprot:TRINITY_DN1106_c0_g1_i1.p2 TRINITY_DN1106_c0_g1~~TRINITY_DN1106_c0_g1_i1.p2  ORF type:complete len:453 (-),score=182.97 TRINITY_DN1106_c0_g1_i1:62-1420(-)